MKQDARRLLSRLGSDKALELNWRDMWAMITVKGGTVHNEFLILDIRK